MFKITKYHRIVSMILIAVMLNSCNHYMFKELRNDPTEQSKKIDRSIRKSYFFIVHAGDSAWQLKNVSATEDKIEGTVTKMHPKVKDYMELAYQGSKKVFAKGDDPYVNQIHIFVDEFDPDTETVSIDKEDILNIDLMYVNECTRALAIVAISLGTLLVALTVLIILACNCPHTYVFDGNQYNYNNTLFTGATSAKLERDDYKVMPDYAPESSEYNFFVRNDESEHQFTNLLELLVIHHDQNIEVSMDQSGRVYGIANPIQPTSVTDNSGNDLTQAIAYNDDNGHKFDNESTDEFNSVVATFDKPTDVSNAKLVLKAKNNAWGGLVYHEFSKMFGKYYKLWVKKNQKKSPEEIQEKMKRAGIPFIVSVKKDGAWVDVETIHLIGDVNYNSLVVPIDPALLTDEKIEVRFTSGFLFWDMDYVNIDFTPETALNVQRIQPSSALGTDNRNDLEALLNDDNAYMKHYNAGDSTSIQFAGIQNVPNQTRTIYLHSKGYYEPLNEYKGKMQRDELTKLDVDGGLSIFSRQLYEEFLLNYSFSAE